MLLSRTKFVQKQANDELRIALIGMSNIGKSHWTRQISTRHGFKTFEVDTAIQEQLELDSISEAANWMGHPYESSYTDKARKYLDLEREKTLCANDIHGNLVLDTTGSIIHLDQHVQDRIKEAFLIVYLEATRENIEILIKRFSTSPKPLIWGGFFHQYENDSHSESLKKSYPKLLSARTKMYENLADITISTDKLKSNANIDFLYTLQSLLEN